MALLTEKHTSVLDMGEQALQERVALIKRLRSMLELQRDKFRSYLSLLEKQEDAIARGDIKAIEAQAQVEQQIIREILSVQKVVTPLNSMYSRMYPQKKEDITQLQTSLDQLRIQVLQRNEMNRELLSRQRDELRERIQALRIPKGRKSIYARETSPGMIDINC